MTKSRICIFRAIVTAALMVVVGVSTTRAQMPRARLPRNPSETPEVAASAKAPRCTIATIAGKWVFTTDLLYTQQGTLDGAALGTLNIGTDGTLQGKYDREGFSGFSPGNSYVGTVSVNPDCTGTVSQHDVGSTLIVLQSILIADNGQEIWGMSHYPTVDVGPFRAKKIGVPRCSIATIAGQWVFTTDPLYLQDGTLDGYATGTLGIRHDGTLDEMYDWEGLGGFYPGNPAVGSVSVNPDCTGIISFHDVGDTQMVVQSVVIADKGQEIWGMFQDPTMDVGVYRVKRITEPRD